jgi:alkylhydroperoxidase family enzyme
MFTKYTTENAPEESKILLQNVQEKFKFLPNQDRILAVAPNIYKAYNDCFDQFLGKSSLGLIAGQVVLMTVSFYNNSPYCMAAHSWGMVMTGVNQDIIDSLRNGSPIKDSKLEELRLFTLLLITNKGNISETQIQFFLESGYTNQNIIEIIGGIATKTIANYTNIIAKTEIDPIMQKYEWSKPTK